MWQIIPTSTFDDRELYFTGRKSEIITACSSKKKKNQLQSTFLYNEGTGRKLKSSLWLAYCFEKLLPRTASCS